MRRTIGWTVALLLFLLVLWLEGRQRPPKKG